jgi:hypothetical protein
MPTTKEAKTTTETTNSNWSPLGKYIGLGMVILGSLYSGSNPLVKIALGIVIFGLLVYFCPIIEIMEICYILSLIIFLGFLALLAWLMIIDGSVELSISNFGSLKDIVTNKLKKKEETK